MIQGCIKNNVDDISNKILKDHKKHYKLHIAWRLLVETDGLDDDLGD